MEIQLNGLVGDSASIIDVDTTPAQEVIPSAPNEGGSEGDGTWTTLGHFHVNSPYAFGITITATLQSLGWALNGSGSTSGTDLNTFTDFRLFSTDSTNYVGINSMSNLPEWGTIDTLPRTFSNGQQSGPMTNWKVLIQAKWPTATGLLGGSYSQTLSIVVENTLLQ